MLMTGSRRGAMVYVVRTLYDGLAIGSPAARKHRRRAAITAIAREIGSWDAYG
jgi:hypothetical protein